MASIPHDMLTQADSQRNGVQPDALHGAMADLDISTNGSATPTETTVTSEATSITEADNEIDGHALALDMQQRCRLLLDELEQLQAHLKDEGKEHSAELRALKTEVQSEMRVIDKVICDASLKTAAIANTGTQIAKNPSNPRGIQSLHSSNLSFFTAVWDTAKKCSGILALRRYFYWHGRKPHINGKVSTSALGRKKRSAVVDIVSQDGLEFVKVSTILEKRIIWDLAKAGWVGSDSSEEAEQSDDDDGPGGILTQAEGLLKASRETRVRYRHPTVRLVFTRISRTPRSKEVAQILQQIRNMGIIVQTSEDILDSPPVADVLDRLAPGNCYSLTDVLNLDCTVLLAFVSDLSHGRVEPQDWHNGMISTQREMEAKRPLLPSKLWPVCESRKLVCTKEAATRMQEISGIIGTPAEKRRTALLLGLNNTVEMTNEQILEEFQTLSEYKVPANWRLPVEVVDVDLAALKSNLPPSVEKVSEALSDMNRSVFVYGWASGFTTLSSNRAVAKDIESIIEENRTSDEVGPDIWPCSLRSLVGKEKERRGAQDMLPVVSS
ncbi:UPF0415 protein-like [Lachnellula cervina]|uniref:UPF0415 protein-like n=1 Tax=Lachnellula cervina TaxID=1316786 RepID=A0A7D8YX91_9HELO|nr:UPF0415 protein-like [Lachnellula cervina]